MVGLLFGGEEVDEGGELVEGEGVGQSFGHHRHGEVFFVLHVFGRDGGDAAGRVTEDHFVGGAFGNESHLRAAVVQREHDGLEALRNGIVGSKNRGDELVGVHD